MLRARRLYGKSGAWSSARVIFVEDNVQDLMELVFDAPMRPRCGQDLGGGELLGRDVKAAALAGLPALFAIATPSAKAVSCGNA